MNLTNLKAGDVVAVDRNGFKFMAFVDDPAARPVKIAPIGPGRPTYRTATAKQVVGIWRRSKATSDPRRQVDDDDFDDS